MRPVPKPKVRHDKKYLEHIRSLPCTACGERAEPHHLAGKENDYATVPLCRKHHTYFHQYGLQGFESRFSTAANRINLWQDAHRIYFNWRDHD